MTYYGNLNTVLRGGSYRLLNAKTLTLNFNILFYINDLIFNMDVNKIELPRASQSVNYLGRLSR